MITMMSLYLTKQSKFSSSLAGIMPVTMQWVPSLPCVVIMIFPKGNLSVVASGMLAGHLTNRLRSYFTLLDECTNV